MMSANRALLDALRRVSGMRLPRPPRARRPQRPRHAWRGLTGAVVVGLLLVAAETYAAWHAADLDAHQADDPCKICLAVSGFSAANVGQAHTPEFPARAVCGAQSVPALCAVRRIVRGTARGPPDLS